MPRYYGTVTITIDGVFEADDIGEIQNDPIRCASDCTFETEIAWIEEADDDWEE